jgi:hypothetical protein
MSRPKETSFGRGLGRCCEAVSILGVLRGEASGELEGEGDEAPSGRWLDMIAAAVGIVLCSDRVLRRARRGPTLVAHSCKDHTRLDWQAPWNITERVEMAETRRDVVRSGCYVSRRY